MHRERPGHTLQATALVHEAYMRLAGGQAAQWQNRAHFFAIAAHAMREVLLDYARRHCAGKRGGNDAQKVEIDDELLVDTDKIESVIAIDELLERLAQIDPRQSRVVELRFFAGLAWRRRRKYGCLPEDDQTRMEIGQSLASPGTGCEERMTPERWRQVRGDFRWRGGMRPASRTGVKRPRSGGEELRGKWSRCLLPTRRLDRCSIIH